MKIIDYQPEHLLMINPQPNQAMIERSDKQAAQLAEYQSFTGIYHGRVVAIGGLIELNPYRAYLYLIVADGVPHVWTKLYRTAKRLITYALQEYLRLETMSSFAEADRWLELLGFEYEGTMRKAGPSGLDAKMYSIVRE